MATRESIEIDFQQAMSQADRIDGIASQLSNLSNNKFGGSLQQLAGGWKGDNAKAYIGKGNALKSNINQSANELREIANAIREAARRIYAAEMAAIDIVNS